MTGYGRAEGTRNGCTLVVELKSVNHRYCEVAIRLPKSLSNIEEAVKKQIQHHITRGRIEFSANLSTIGSRNFQLDLDAAGAYYQALKTLKDRLHLVGEIDVSILHSFREMITTTEPTEVTKPIAPLLMKTLSSALQALEKMKRAEGQALATDLTERLNGLSLNLNEIQQRTKTVVGLYHQRLTTRVAELSKNLLVDPNRLAQEVALFSDRCDVSEEITRLKTHIDQFKKMLQKKEAIGRTLDFLIQEMNREANTIGSKANDATMSHHVVALKSELEKIREQVQNIE